ncbi:head-tail adaptor protein [Pseudomonas sp. FFUP_PS_473]|uniref:head-tail adaptor protein n=1 Tax=Pseudomonas sp. FFUP_PS_473 TaxID=2060418 RepID=UPI000C7A22F4|nr:head-tail adaptor protein [Pseudomonas sp. FFUP_PS_473]PLP87617.1 head-tail adaptor protein [Pseudomonas sp. FFUP_PS_473]
MAIREPSSGELRARMAVRVRVDKPAGPGLVPEFTHVCNRWAKVEPLGTATYANAQQTGNKITHRLYCRHIPGLDSAYELVWHDRVFRVRRPTDLAGRMVWSVIEVEELGPDGPPANEGGSDEQFGFR